VENLESLGENGRKSFSQFGIRAIGGEWVDGKWGCGASAGA